MNFFEDDVFMNNCEPECIDEFIEYPQCNESDNGTMPLSDFPHQTADSEYYHIINPTPVVDKNQPCHCHHHHHHHPEPPCPHGPKKPLQWEEDGQYVTKHELNRILRHISEADIFNDLSPNGTTVSVGGIKKGTKFNKLTFSKFVEKLLYPRDGRKDVYVTREELHDILAKVAFTGSYDDLRNKPEHPTPSAMDYIYPCKDDKGRRILNFEVKYPMGEFMVGDSLENLTIAQIIEKMLCGSSGTWGSYEWKTQLYDLYAGEVEIDATEFCPKLVDDVEEALRTGGRHAYNELMKSGVYELYSPCVIADKDNNPSDPESGWDTEELIALQDTLDTDHPQRTKELFPDIDSNLTWSYDHTTKKITLSDAILTNRCMVLIKRYGEEEDNG